VQAFKLKMEYLGQSLQLIVINIASQMKNFATN